jgi:hypothetical protein
MSTYAQKMLKGAVTKHVLCANCGSTYAYEMSRTVFGKCEGDVSTRAEADAEALRDAEIKLKLALDGGCDVVGCPSCGAITEAMKTYRRGFFLGTFGCIGFGVACLVVVFILMLILGKIFIFPAVVGCGLILIGTILLLSGSWRMVIPKKGKAQALC